MEVEQNEGSLAVQALYDVNQPYSEKNERGKRSYNRTPIEKRKKNYMAILVHFQKQIGDLNSKIERKTDEYQKLSSAKERLEKILNMRLVTANNAPPSSPTEMIVVDDDSVENLLQIPPFPEDVEAQEKEQERQMQQQKNEQIRLIQIQKEIEKQNSNGKDKEQSVPSVSDKISEILTNASKNQPKTPTQPEPSTSMQDSSSASISKPNSLPTFSRNPDRLISHSFPLSALPAHATLSAPGPAPSTSRQPRVQQVNQPRLATTTEVQSIPLPQGLLIPPFSLQQQQQQIMPQYVLSFQMCMVDGTRLVPLQQPVLMPMVPQSNRLPMTGQVPNLRLATANNGT